MTQGLALHTHADVQGVQGVRLLKVVEEGDRYFGAFGAEWELRRHGAGWRADGDQPVEINALRDEAVVSPGDVVRVREGSSLVQVLWRRQARTNALFATDRCNSLCLMCSQPPRDVQDDWRADEMIATVALIDREAEQLGITGGEPTLLGHGLTRVLEACSERLPDTRLHILTNGRTFRDPASAEQWCGATSNTTWAVPLYADVAAVHDEVVGAPGAFVETLDGLYQLARLGSRVELRVVLHRLTIPRLPQLAAFIYRRLPFVTHVALMGLEPMGLAKGNRERLWIDPVDYADQLSDAVFFLAARSVPVSVYNLPLCTLERPLWPFARQSISEWKNNYVPDCDGCLVRDHCAGFFASAGAAWRSRAVAPIRQEDLTHELA